MQTTMTLLERALKIAPVPVWTEKFKLTRSAISVAKASGHLTPVIAGHFAIELNEDPKYWMSLAVIEGEKGSPSKKALEKKLSKAWLNSSLVKWFKERRKRPRLAIS